MNIERPQATGEDALAVTGVLLIALALTRGPKAKALSAKLRGARDLLRMATELGMLSGLGPVKTFASIAMSDDVTMFYAHMIAGLEGNSPTPRPVKRAATGASA